nr:MAG TPA: portal protein [Caudoviricetes sp.]
MNGDTRAYTVWHGASWDNDTYRSSVDAIARNAAKLKGRHVITTEDGRRTAGNPTITRLLETAPNPIMSAYDFLYRLTADLYLNGNAFALIDRDTRGNVAGFYPITASGVEWLTDESGRIYVKFRFRSGKTAIFDYSQIVHVRRHFATDELMGDNDSAIRGTLELAETQNRGAIEAIKSGAQLRGILKFTSIQSPEMLAKNKAQFIADYLDMSNNGGIVVTDAKSEYEPIDSKPTTIDAAQYDAVSARIYAYLGISREIVTSSYTEDQWAAFYESVLEPLCVAYSQAFTTKVFTARERAYGNSIEFDGGRMLFASNQTKLQMIQQLTPLGLLTVNEAREILNLSPVPDGDTRLQSLNYVDASKANQYQLGKDDTTTDSEVKA